MPTITRAGPHLAGPGAATCVILTGMSGTGKSTLIAELAARGYRTSEPKLRRVADHEIDTSAPLADVLAQLLGIAGVR